MQLAHVPLPGTWVIDAQAVLDDLARHASFEEVAAHHSSPRRICEAIFGYPAAGGCATKPLIRAVGALLRHRLGPAVAVEALSWAASVTEALDPTSLAMFLEAAADSDIALRPLRLDERFTLAAPLIDMATPRERREALARWWRRREPVDYYPVDDDLDEVDPAEWLAWVSASADEPSGRTGLADRLARESTGARQLALYGGAKSWERDELAGDPALFDLKPAVIRQCVLDHVAAVLNNPACPRQLVDRVRNPYDEATLELALRAGCDFYNPLRVRRMLEDRSSPVVADLGERLPYELLAALSDTGLLTADDLIDGVLRGVDPAKRARIRRAALPAPWNRPARRRITSDRRWVLDLLARHPDGDRWLWTLETCSPAPEEMRTLTGAAHPAVRRRALALLDPDQLVATDALLAASVGGDHGARCPGIPAVDRPLGVGVDALRYEEDAGTVAHRYSYPDEIESLTSVTFEDALDWRITLPTNRDDLARNARLMRNCTAHYHDQIATGDVVILGVHSPTGQRFNVSLHRTREIGEWSVGQVNSWHNGGIEPEWIEPALTRWFTMDLWRANDPFDSPEPHLRNRHRRSRRRQ